MTEELERQKPFLDYLINSVKGRGVKSILKTLNKSQIDVISEIIINLLQKTIELSDDEKKILTKNKAFIRKIGNPKSGYRKRKKILQSHPVVTMRILKLLWPKIKDISAKDVTH